MSAQKHADCGDGMEGNVNKRLAFKWVIYISAFFKQVKKFVF